MPLRNLCPKYIYIIFFSDYPIRLRERYTELETAMWYRSPFVDSNLHNYTKRKHTGCESLNGRYRKSLEPTCIHSIRFFGAHSTHTTYPKMRHLILISLIRILYEYIVYLLCSDEWLWGFRHIFETCEFGLSHWYRFW